MQCENLKVNHDVHVSRELPARTGLEIKGYPKNAYLARGYLKLANE